MSQKRAETAENSQIRTKPKTVTDMFFVYRGKDHDIKAPEYRMVNHIYCLVVLR